MKERESERVGSEGRAYCLQSKVYVGGGLVGRMWYGKD